MRGRPTYPSPITPTRADLSRIAFSSDLLIGDARRDDSNNDGHPATFGRPTPYGTLHLARRLRKMRKAATTRVMQAPPKPLAGETEPTEIEWPSRFSVTMKICLRSRRWHTAVRSKF